MGHFGQYTILGNIGEGAHGIVFKAKHIEVRFSYCYMYGMYIALFEV